MYAHALSIPTSINFILLTLRVKAKNVLDSA